MNVSDPWRILFFRNCYERGFSMRLTARLANAHKVTVARYYKQFRQQGLVCKCKCGRDGQHRGWCSWRYQQSEFRVAPNRKRKRLSNGGSWYHLAWERSKEGKAEIQKFKEETQWLKQAKVNLAQVKQYLRDNQRRPWQSPPSASAQGSTSPTS